MKIYLISLISILSLFAYNSAPTTSAEQFTCGDTTDAFGVYITDANGVNVSGQVLNKQTPYTINIDMNNSLAPCGHNPAYVITGHWGLVPNYFATDSNCGDSTFPAFMGGVIPKGTMSWGIEVTPYGIDTVTGSLCLNYNHTHTITGTAN